MLDFYAENGPSGFSRYRLRKSKNDFGIEGYLVMLVGNRVPYRRNTIPHPRNSPAGKPTAPPMLRTPNADSM